MTMTTHAFSMYRVRCAMSSQNKELYKIHIYNFFKQNLPKCPQVPEPLLVIRNLHQSLWARVLLGATAARLTFVVSRAETIRLANCQAAPPSCLMSTADYSQAACVTRNVIKRNPLLFMVPTRSDVRKVKTIKVWVNSTPSLYLWRRGQTRICLWRHIIQLLKLNNAGRVLTYREN